MTERKPAGVPWESWVERRIREAQETGAFDDLPGAGKPIADLDQPYDADWWLRSFLQREQLQVLPDTLELQKFVEKELERIAAFHSESSVRRELQQLNSVIRERIARATSGPASRVTLIDIDDYVARWNENSSA